VCEDRRRGEAAVEAARAVELAAAVEAAVGAAVEAALGAAKAKAAEEAAATSAVVAGLEASVAEAEARAEEHAAVALALRAEVSASACFCGHSQARAPESDRSSTLARVSVSLSSGGCDEGPDGCSLVAPPRAPLISPRLASSLNALALVDPATRKLSPSVLACVPFFNLRFACFVLWPRRRQVSALSAQTEADAAACALDRAEKLARDAAAAQEEAEAAQARCV